MATPCLLIYDTWQWNQTVLEKPNKQNQNPPERGELLMENKAGQNGVKNIKLL